MDVCTAPSFGTVCQYGLLMAQDAVAVSENRNFSGKFSQKVEMFSVRTEYEVSRPGIRFDGKGCIGRHQSLSVRCYGQAQQPVSAEIGCKNIFSVR